MDERERLHEPHGGSPASTGTGGAGPGALNQLSRDAQRFLAAGDAAINRSLSGDSEAFLRANRQEGGQ